MKITWIASIFMVLVVAGIASAQVRGLQKGSVEAGKAIAEYELQEAMQRTYKGQYFDELSSLWSSDKFNLDAPDPNAEYSRLAKQFQVMIEKKAVEQLEKAEKRLYAIRRGRVTRAAKRPVQQKNGNFYFNHGDAKDKEEKRQQKFVDAFEQQLKRLQSKNVLPHIPMSEALVSEGVAMHIPSYGVVMQVVDEKNMIVFRKDSLGDWVYYWIDGYSTKGLADDDVFSPDAVFVVDGTKTYKTRAGSKTVKVLRHVPVDNSKFITVD